MYVEQRGRIEPQTQPIAHHARERSLVGTLDGSEPLAQCPILNLIGEPTEGQRIVKDFPAAGLAQ